MTELPIDDDEARRRDLETLLDEIESGAIEEVGDLDEAQRALLRHHLSDEELERLFDRAAGPEPE